MIGYKKMLNDTLEQRNIIQERAKIKLRENFVKYLGQQIAIADCVKLHKKKE